MVSIPDANGDGNAELAIGSPEYDGAGLAQGRVQLFSGDSTLSYPILFSIDGTSNFEYLGSALDEIEDPDASGAPCMVITWRGKTNSSFQPFAGGGGIYRATDGVGLSSAASSTVFVPHDQGGVTEPLMLWVTENGWGTVLTWDAVPGTSYYDVVRGELANIREKDEFYHMGQLACTASATTQTDTVGLEDPELPPSGETFFYLAEYNDGLPSGYGTVSAAKERFVPPGQGCP